MQAEKRAELRGGFNCTGYYTNKTEAFNATGKLRGQKEGAGEFCNKGEGLYYLEPTVATWGPFCKNLQREYFKNL